VLAEYFLATGRPTEAIGLLERTIATHANAEPKYGDTLLLWAARAAAALPASRRRGALDAVLAARERCPVPMFAGGDRDPGQRAVQALFEAESARCHGEPDEVDRWRAAIPLADEAGLMFVATDARLRLAEALLAVRDRRAAGALLREAHTAAQRMGARRLRDEIAEVAASARIALDEPRVPAQQDAAVNGLTRREQEVMAHLVAGRSYSEIASALFISEKTVSVHVSNVLRKTGTSSRVEAAAWGRRNGAVPPG
jgi:DNA-binding CsgD family transcriptional regulator